MKDYFKDNEKSKDASKKFFYDMYDKIDDTFDRRFNDNNSSRKTKRIDEINKIIREVKDEISKNQNIDMKVASLTLGNAYLRLAQCQDEYFKFSSENYKKAGFYLDKYINHLAEKYDEIDLLLMINKGKYFRNAAEAGHKNDFKKAFSIFSDVADNVDNTEIDDIHKLHIMLDAKINIGRVLSYRYLFTKASSIFIYIISALKPYLETKENNIVKKINACQVYKELEFEISNIESENDKDRIKNNDLHEIDKKINKIKNNKEIDYINNIGKEIGFIKGYLLQALLHLGINCRKNNELDKALELFMLMNDIDCISDEDHGGDDDFKINNIDAVNNIAVCFRKMQKRNEEINAINLKKKIAVERKAKELKEKGNKFAEINDYKIRLISGEEECKTAIKELQKNYEDKIPYINFLLGRLYYKTNDINKAIECFSIASDGGAYIARGSLGLKANYNLAKCLMENGEIRQARDILHRIRKSIGGENDYLDIRTEMDYAICLMHEGDYEAALDIFKKLYNEAKVAQGLSYLHLKLKNNIIDCLLHMDHYDEAKDVCNGVHSEYKNTDKDTDTEYFIGLIKLHDLLEKEQAKNAENNNRPEISEYRDIYNYFKEIMGKNSINEKIFSGWLISACLLYKNMSKEDIESKRAVKESIARKIQYSSNPISMRSYFYMAEFIAEQYNNGQDEDIYDSNLLRDFCHMPLVRSEENDAFRLLMLGEKFHLLQIKDRAYILSRILLIYKNILKIKNRQIYHRELKKDNEALLNNNTKADTSIADNVALPYHYTKLDTIIKLVKSNPTSDSRKCDEPRLRLWNTAYMNDNYEGTVFDSLLNNAALDYCSDKCGETDLVSVNSNINNTLKKYIGNKGSYPLNKGSNVYITSFSTQEDSFQMWSIYGDNEKGGAIKFDKDFFDIKPEWNDVIMGGEANECTLYNVRYFNNKALQDYTSDKIDKELKENMVGIWRNISEIENKLNELKETYISNKSSIDRFEDAETEIRSFITDRLNEVRFLFKTEKYEYEAEQRLIKCSHSAKTDDANFEIPRLYIDVDRDIKDVEVMLGSKLESKEKTEMLTWLYNTDRVKKADISKL